MKLFKLTIMAIIAVILTLTYSCQQESLIEQDYSDMPYLSLPESTDFDNLSMTELQIIMEAFDRMKIIEAEDGLAVMKTRNGLEVNVSENLFSYCCSIIWNTNHWLLSNYNHSRSSNIRPIERPGYGETDCLSHAISLALKKPYNEVDRILTNHYGYDGIPLEYAYQALSLFGRVARMDVNQIPNNTAMPEDDYTHIAFIQGGHAVNIIGYFNGRLYFVDPQSGHKAPLEIPVGDATHLYHYY